MAKPLIDQLQAALAAGDVEKARAIGLKMAAQAGKAKPKAKAKAKVAAPEPPPPAPSPRARAKVKAPSPLILPDYDEEEDDAVDSIPYEDDGAGEYDPRNASWMAPAKRADAAPRTKVDASGTLRRESRRVSMRGNEFVNTFKDRGQGGYDRPVHAKLDKANGRNEAAIDRRPPARKVKVRCGGCRRPFSVYSGELRPVIDDDGGGRELVYNCDRCTRKGLV